MWYDNAINAVNFRNIERKNILPPLAAISSEVSIVSALYLADRIIKTSTLGYMLVESIFGVVYYAPIVYCRDKIDKFYSVSNQDLLDVTFYLEVPTLVSEYCFLKMYEHQVALPTAIFSSYPMINVMAEKLTPQIHYEFTDDSITIRHGLKTSFSDIAQDIAYISLYAGSTFLIYLDEKQAVDSDKDTTTAVMYAAISAISASICVHYVNVYGVKHDPEILTLLDFVTGIPLRIAACTIGYLFVSSMSFEHDFIDNASDLAIISGLSAMSLFFLLAGNYAFTHMEHVSDCAVLSMIAANNYSLLLSEHFNDKNFTAYSISGAILGIISCGAFMMHNRNQDDEKIVGAFKLLNQVIHENGSQIMQSINSSTSNEFDNCSQLLLAILKNELSVKFNIKDNQGIKKIVISNNSSNEILSEIDICINLESVHDKLLYPLEDGLALLPQDIHDSEITPLNVELVAESSSYADFSYGSL